MGWAREAAVGGDFSTKNTPKWRATSGVTRIPIPVMSADTAGICSGSAPDNARLTAFALSSPDTTNQTSRARDNAGNVSEIRVGGGFGAS